MSKLTQTGPLINLHQRNSIQEIQVHRHEPIIPPPGSRRKRLGMQVLNGLARLELLLMKDDLLADGRAEKTRTALASEIERTLTSITAALSLHFESQEVSLKKYMQDMSLVTVFPLSAKRAAANNAAPASKDIHSHFHQMNLTNQLVSIALQLQNDLRLTNHKYMAHQLALLYIGGMYLKYKSRVESRFDDVKALTNSAEEPLLSMELTQWLRSLTTDIVTEALFISRPLPTQSSGLIKFLDKLKEPNAED
ncbi:hypothetical protein BC937DRAFT_95279 [Endogone sp. FLAS-F59071]|nr:hypothetical protein BC937DRAFT_95279 [Endogone sp. FLAS-F59071]|eukprot:RUS13461.1 hypothetical protein BC937DRAFT_95279 [Endogone sp. FLAS-F59071]